MKKLFFITAMLCLLVLIACNRSDKKGETTNVFADQISNAPSSGTATGDSVEGGQIPLAGQQISPTDSATSTIPAKPIVNADWDKKIIKTASLKLEVPDFKKYNDAVYKIVRQSGAYIAQEEQGLTAEKNETVITIKVPVYQFETLMNELAGSDAKVIERKISTDDVTGKIVDTKSRLEAKKEMRLKYLEFLKQSKNMKEVLQVQAEVDNIQEEMEAAAGQVNYLSHQSALSTINLSFYQLLPGYKPDVIENPSFLTRVSRAFKAGSAWIADIFVGLLSIWPFLLIIFIAIFIWKKAYHERVLTSPAQSPGKK